MTSPVDTGAAEGLPPSSAAPTHAPAESSAESSAESPAGRDQAGTQWVVLAAPGAQTVIDRPVRMRRVIAVVGVAAVVILLVVAFAGALLSRRIAENQAVHAVAQMTDLLADTVVQPALTDRMASDSREATRVLDPNLRGAASTSGIVRVKLWSPSGMILYSDESRLIGQTYPLAEDARAAFRVPHTRAEISDLRRPENAYEREQGKLLEVYRPVWTPSGDPLLFETYFKYDTVTARSSELWRGFGGIMLSSLAALMLLMIPLVWLVVANARRSRTQHEALMQRALDASDEERRRIAASLHDGVVQQLAAASFIAAGEAEKAADSGDPARADGLRTVATTVRDSIAGLRSLLVDIYPASLHSSGLAVALRDLARTTGATDAAVDTEVDEQVADGLSIEVQECVFRVAQEALRNAIRHSDARRLRLSLTSSGIDQAVLEVADDGRGFALDGIAPQGAGGHFGLPLMADATRKCGGELAVSSSPGGGTIVRMTVRTTVRIVGER
jgi:signal transduction histidine kinase